MPDHTADAGPDAVYQSFLAQNRFMIQRGKVTGKHVYFPRKVAPGTGEDLEWVEASGFGTVYSATAIRQRPPAGARSIVLVDLDEGPRMMSRVDGIDALDVRIGMRVKSRIVAAEDADAGLMVVFEPAGDVL